MNKFLIAVIIVLGLGLAASIYFCITLARDKSSLTAELQTVQNTLASTQAQLAHTSRTLNDTQKTLATTQEDLDSTKDTLTSTQSELDTTKDELASTQSELDTTHQTLSSKLAELESAYEELASAQKSATTLENTLSNTQKKLANAQETLEGLGITISASYECSDVELVDNPEAGNPTWKELKAFLSEDQTENHKYIAHEYDCSEFSRDVHNNAEAAGIRAAEVQILFKDEKTGHALNAFLTTDCGLVYIDCTESPDRIAYIKAGKLYKAIQVERMVTGANLRNDSWWNSLGSYYYMPSSTGGHQITSRIRIYW